MERLINNWLKVSRVGGIALLMILSVQCAFAATRTWTGTTNANWNVDANWGGTKPVAGDDLVFPDSPASGQYSTNNDIAATTSFNSVTINGTGYTLAGNSITIGASGITSNKASGSNTISLALILSADRSITVTNSDETLTVSGIISGGFSLTKAGAGTLTLSGNNTYTGTTTITGGTLSAVDLLGNPSSIGNASSAVVIQSGGILSYTGGSVSYVRGLTTDSGVGQVNNAGVGTLTIATADVVTTGGTFTVGGSGAVTVSSVISGTGGVTMSGTGTLTLSGSNTFSNGLTIKSGTVNGTTSANAFGGTGTGTITLGDSAGGSTNASLGATELTFANPIVLASNTTGTLTISNVGSTQPVFTGGVTGNNNLTIKNVAPGANTMTFSTATINNVGTINNEGTGASGVTISAVIGTNVTGVIQNSSTSALTLAGNNTFTSGLTIKSGTVRASTHANALGGSGTGIVTLGDSAGGSNSATLMAVSDLTLANPIVLASNTTGTLSVSNSGSIISAYTGGVTGTNNLTIVNAQAGLNTITFSTTSVNNVGTVTSAGTGSANTVISAVIGTNVTEVIQNSSTSALALSGNNTFTGSGLTIKKGTVIGTTSVNALGGSGTGIVTLGDSAGGSNNASVLAGTDDISFANPIVLASNTTGTLTIGGSNSSSDVIFTGGVTGNNNFTISNASVNRTTTFSTGAINNTGTVTNVAGCGSGTCPTTISAVIGTNVTGVVQNDAAGAGASILTLSGANVYTGTTTVTSGTLAAGVASVANTSGAFGNNSAVTMANTSGAILDITGFNTQIGSITGGGSTGGSVTLGAATLTVGGSTSPAAYAGAISGTGALVKSGAGTLTLSGTNTYTGTTTITGGTLSAVKIVVSSSDSSIGNASSAVVIQGGGILSYTGATASYIRGFTTSSGVGQVNYSGGGTLTIATGGIDTTGGTFTIGGSGTVAISSVISGTGGVTLAGTGTLTLSGNNTFSNGLTIKSGTVSGTTSANAFGGTGTGTITLGDSAGGSNNATLNGGQALTFANPIVLASNTTDTLSITSSSNASVIFSGGVTGTNNLTINTPNTTNAVTFSTASLNNTGTITNVSTGAASVTISAVIGTNVTEVIQNSSTSTLALSGNNTFTGSGLTIKSGTVIGTTSANAFGGSGVGTVTIGDSAGGSNNATLYAGTALTFANPIVLASNTTGTLTVGDNGGGGGHIVSFTGGVTGANNLTINGVGGNSAVTFSTASMNNVGTVTHIGSGATTISAVIGTNVTEVIQNSSTSQLTLTGNNTFTGNGLTIKSGTVRGSTSANCLGGSGTGVVTLGDSAGGSNNATLSTSALTLANPIVLASNTTGTLSVSNTGGASTTFTGGVTGTNNLTIAFTSTGAATFSTTSVNNTGTITNAGSGSGTTIISAVIGTNVTGVVQNSATSTTTLSGANTYTGTTTVTAGTLKAGVASVANTSGAFGNNSAVTMANTSGAILDITGFNTQIGSITGGGSTGGGVTLGAATLTVGGSTSPAAYGGVISGTGALVKSGSGTLTLSGSSTYTGTTTITAGTLSADTIVVSGSASNLGNASSAVVIQTDGILSYTGATASYTRGITTSSGVGQVDNAGAGTLTIATGGIDTTGGTFKVGGSGATTVSAVISGTGAVSKAGAGTLTLSGNNTYTGTTTITAGTLSAGDLVGNPSSIGNASSAVVIQGGGILSYTGGSVSYVRGLTIDSGVGQVNNAGAGTLTIATADVVTTGGTFTVGDAGAVTVSAVISGTGAVTMNGTGTLILSANNTFSNDLTIKKGTVVGMTHANAFGESGTGTIILGNSAGGSDNATLIGHLLTFANPIVLAANTTGALTLVQDNTYYNSSFTGGITGTNDLVIDLRSTTGSETLTLATGAINHTGKITNIQTGASNVYVVINSDIGSNVTEVIQNGATSSLFLAGNNSFGALTIKKGTVSGNTSNNVFGAGAITLGNSAGGSDSATLMAGPGTYANAIALAANTTGTLTIGENNSHYDAIFTGGVTGTNNLTIDLGSTNGSQSIVFSTGAVNNAGTITNVSSGISSNVATISSVIGTNVTGVIQNSATSQLTLSGTNTYTTASTITAGTLSISADRNLGDVPGVATPGLVTINGGTLASTATFTLNANRGIALGASHGTISVAAARTLTYGGAISGSGNLTKTTTGGLTFSANQALGGGLTLSAGTITAPSALSVAGDLSISGGTFTHNSGTVTLNGSAGQTVTSGSNTYNNLIVTNAHASGVTFADAFTTASFTDTTPASVLKFQNGTNYTISGALTLAGTAGNLITLNTDDGAANNFEFTVSGGAASVSYLNVARADASTNDITCANCTNGGNNNGGSGDALWIITAPSTNTNAIFFGTDF